MKVENIWEINTSPTVIKDLFTHEILENATEYMNHTVIEIETDEYDLIVYIEKDEFK